MKLTTWQRFRLALSDALLLVALVFICLFGLITLIYGLPSEFFYDDREILQVISIYLLIVGLVFLVMLATHLNQSYKEKDG